MSPVSKGEETTNQPSSTKRENDLKNGISQSDLKALEVKLNSVVLATNRVNHVLRAVVRFFLVQLAFSTAALVVYFLNLLTIDEDDRDCRVLEQCEPSAIGSFMVFALLVAGIVISSSLAWKELEKSDIPGVHSGKIMKF